ncbi:MAG TPA: indolepyruvate/phenylpyruvate decarboxylase [Thermoanaerobaculia bacterium]
MSTLSSPTPPKHPVERPAGNPTLSRFILDQLVEAGVESIFAIPGDFILRLCQVIERDPRLRLLTMSHEPGVGFAASGAARGVQGIGVACVTYGAGALNMVNPVAAAYAEKTPLLVLTGGPGEDERSRGILVHHQVKSFESQLKVFHEVTHYQAVLDDPETAADQVRYAIDLCRLYSLPVYLEVPRDMVDREIHLSPVRRLEVPARPGAVEEAAGEILRKLTAARRPVMVVGVEVHRQRLAQRVVRLAERLGITVVTTFMGRGAFPDDHPHYAGVYLGPASRPGVRELVEESDFVLMLGALITDTNMGVRITALDPRHIALAVSRRVEIGYHRYEDVPLDALVDQLLDHPGSRPRGDWLQSAGRIPFMRADDEPSAGPIRVAAMIAEINRFFAERGEMPLVTDTGDCLFCSNEIDTQMVLASAYYATMGFGVPAALGFEAATGRRPLVLVGDGGFQMTGPELAQALHWGCKPIVVLMNNNSWEMLQSFLPTGYNRIPDWRYAELAALWGCAAWRAGTAAELRAALHAALDGDRPALIEVTLAPGDISSTLYSFTRNVGTTPPPPAG